MSAGLCELDRSVARLRLIRWGEWKMKSCVSLGYSSMSSFMKLGARTNTYRDSFGEIDAECSMTDRAVLMMPDQDKLFPVLRAEYLYCYKESAVKAHSCRICKRTYYNRLTIIHEHVANNINYLLRGVHKNDINLLNLHQCV